MGNVLDDVTDETVDKAHVLRRVEDWQQRLHGLYDMIKEWLPYGWTVQREASVSMHEGLMRKFDIEPKRLPTLNCDNGKGTVITLEPRALWIIGANGRVDLKCGKEHYLIVDLAENFETPTWQAAPAERRSERRAVSSDWLRSILP
ncbi:MAG: hypothetical protein OXP66_14725 [Candidatus Tectomicrobia bacterium]|nr:hypothetical protein [Candidatus Tectomicrobia bacterium]